MKIPVYVVTGFLMAGKTTFLRRLCQMRKVLHIADAGQIELLLGQTGDALPEQVAICNFIVTRGLDSPQRRWAALRTACCAAAAVTAHRESRPACVTN